MREGYIKSRGLCVYTSTDAISMRHGQPKWEVYLQLVHAEESARNDDDDEIK